MTQQDDASMTHPPQQPLDEMQALVGHVRFREGLLADFGMALTRNGETVSDSILGSDLSETAPVLGRAADALERQAQEIQRLREERDFLLARSKAAGSCLFSLERWTGMSSNALVEVAFGEPNGCLPMDGQDLAACYRTVTRMPKHLRTDAVFDQLEQGEREVSESNLTWAREVTKWPGRAALSSQENKDDR